MIPKKTIDEDGTVTWWEHPSGDAHRSVSPARIDTSGTSMWYVNGSLQHDSTLTAGGEKGFMSLVERALESAIAPFEEGIRSVDRGRR
jgi:hypothetical protein